MKIFEAGSSKEAVSTKNKIKSRSDSLSTISTSSSSRKRSVSFTKLVNVRATLHTNDMTSDEIRNTWYTQEELYTLKKQIAAQDDSRGLEARSREGRKRRHQNVYTSLNLVMDEQDLQYMNGEYHPETIREIYLEVSWKSQAVARHLGREDELFVRSMIENEMKSIRNQF